MKLWRHYSPVQRPFFPPGTLFVIFFCFFFLLFLLYSFYIVLSWPLLYYTLSLTNVRLLWTYNMHENSVLGRAELLGPEVILLAVLWSCSRLFLPVWATRYMPPFQSLSPTAPPSWLLPETRMHLSQCCSCLSIHKHLQEGSLTK